MNIKILPWLSSFLNPGRSARIFFLPLFLLAASASVFGQDIHYAQFHNAPMNLNPALTGIFKGDIRFAANYRSQWSSVPADYMTFTAMADMKFINKTYRKGFFSGGLAFNYDQAGDSKLNVANLGLSGSYSRQLSPHFFGTVGAQLSGNQRAFSTDELRWDRQFNEESGSYDPTLSPGEAGLNGSNFYVDFSAGINFRLQSFVSSDLVDRLDKRNKLDFGLGLFHLNRPDQSLYEGDEVSLSMRLSPYVIGALMLGPSLDLTGRFTAQFQGPYREYLAGLGGRLHIDRQLGNQLAVELGVGYRFNAFGDAFIPGIEIHYNAWRAGFSYDINVSDFNVATRRRGGPEFSIRYLIRKVRPLPEFKICPLI